MNNQRAWNYETESNAMCRIQTHEARPTDLDDIWLSYDLRTIDAWNHDVERVNDVGVR